MKKRQQRKHPLLFNYCPLCLQVSQEGCSVLVGPDDARVDQAQLFCAINGRNGLRLIDLAFPGKPCQRPSCKLMCLVSDACFTWRHVYF